MTAALVLDASIALSWCFGDESTPEGRKVLNRLEEDAALVPAHWYLEITNALAIAERRQRIAAARVADYLHQLSVLEIEVDHRASERAFEQLLPLCRAHGLAIVRCRLSRSGATPRFAAGYIRC